MAYDHDKWFQLALARGDIVIVPQKPEPAIAPIPEPKLPPPVLNPAPRSAWWKEAAEERAERERQKELSLVPARKRALEYARIAQQKNRDKDRKECHAEVVTDIGVLCRELYEQIDEPQEWEHAALAVGGCDYNVYLTSSEIDALFQRPKHKKKRWWKYEY